MKESIKYSCHGSQKLQNKYEAALRRLKPLQRRLQRKPELSSKYKQTIDNYIKQGYARKLTEEKGEKVSNRPWYLPHHPLFNPKKTDKIRVAFDAAAKNKGQSLNLSLCTGPDLLNSLIGILLRFRNNNIAIVDDGDVTRLG